MNPLPNSQPRPHLVPKEDAIAWGITYLVRFLKGDFVSWEDALSKEGCVDRNAKFSLFWFGQDTNTLENLVERTGHLTPEELLEELSADDLAKWREVLVKTLGFTPKALSRQPAKT